MFPPEMFLERVAAMLRDEIAPVVEAGYPRTQAYMASVVLERVGRQVAGQAADQAATSAERAQMIADLTPELAGSALAAYLSDAGDDTGLCRFVEALYAARDRLGEDTFERVLGRVRSTMRLQLDRHLAIAEG